MPTEAGLPGWFPEDFSTDPELHAAFEDAADWHAAGRKPGKAAVKARLRARLKDRAAAQPGQAGVHAHANTWDDLASVIEMAAGL